MRARVPHRRPPSAEAQTYDCAFLYTTTALGPDGGAAGVQLLDDLGLLFQSRCFRTAPGPALLALHVAAPGHTSSLHRAREVAYGVEAVRRLAAAHGLRCVADGGVRFATRWPSWVLMFMLFDGGAGDGGGRGPAAAGAGGAGADDGGTGRGEGPDPKRGAGPEPVSEPGPGAVAGAALAPAPDDGPGTAADEEVLWDEGVGADPATAGMDVWGAGRPWALDRAQQTWPVVRERLRLPPGRGGRRVPWHLW